MEGIKHFRLPPVPAVFACLVLFALAELGGAIMGGAPERIKDFAIERAKEHPEVHGLTGIEDIDRTILVKVSSKALSRLHTFHLHSHGVGLLSFVLFTIIINSHFSSMVEKTLNLLTAVGMFYPFGWLFLMFTIPVVGEQDALGFAEKYFFMPFGGGMLLAVWLLLLFYLIRIINNMKNNGEGPLEKGGNKK